MKFKARSQQVSSEVMEFWPEEVDGEIILKCGYPCDVDGWYVATVKTDGTLLLHGGLDEDIGLKLDEHGRIVVKRDI